jgi:transmembrane sensor
MRSFWKFWFREPTDNVSKEGDPDLLLNLSLTRHTLPDQDVSELWKRIQQGNDPQQIKITRRSPYVRWYWIAAALVVMSATAALLLTGTDRREYRTAFGETKTIVLPDRSTVILNANSSVSFDNHWENRATREIRLDGEAYFSVVHRQNHQPFRVITPGGVAVEVLGTTFNVYHRSVETKVVLNSGAISLSFPVDKKEKKILMKPGELVEYKKDTYSKRAVDPRVYAAWTEKKIILNQTSLREMIRMANDNYGLEIEVENVKMLDQTVSGSMPIVDSESFVNQVAKAFQLKVVRENNQIFYTE